MYFGIFLLLQGFGIQILYVPLIKLSPKRVNVETFPADQIRLCFRHLFEKEGVGVSRVYRYTKGGNCNPRTEVVRFQITSVFVDMTKLLHCFEQRQRDLRKLHEIQSAPSGPLYWYRGESTQITILCNKTHR